MTATLREAPAPTPAAPGPAGAAARRPWLPRLRRRGGPPAPRHAGLDAARGLAIIGMLIAHTAVVGVWGQDASAFLGFAHGRSSILFATIAGLSLAIITGGPHPPSDAALPATRLRILGRAAALLLLAGLVELLPLSVACILASYALWFVLVIPALRWQPRTLLLVAGGLALGGNLLRHAVLTLVPKLGGRLENSADNVVPQLLFGGTYPATVWLAFVLTGLAIGRIGLENTRALKRLAVVGAALFVVGAAPFVIMERGLGPLFAAPAQITADPPANAAGQCLDVAARKLISCSEEDYLSQLPALTPEQVKLRDRLMDEAEGRDPATGSNVGTPPADAPATAGDGNAFPDLGITTWTLSPHSGSPFEVASSGGLAVALICGLVLLGRRTWAVWAMLPLIGVGAMTLTAYVAHIVVLGFGPPDPSLGNWYVLWLALGLVVGCGIWRAVFRSGPLEQFAGALADRFATVKRRRKSSAAQAD